MKLAFILDPLQGLDPAVDTTVGMIEAAQERGHDVWVAETRDLAVLDGRAHARLRRVQVATAVRRAGRFVLPSAWYSFTDEVGPWLPLDSMDGVFFRPDPPLDQAYLHATYILDLIDRDRTAVVNDPRGVRLANEKLFALQFPELVPPTVVTADAGVIVRFARNHGLAILKPVDGHAGIGVLQLDTGDPNLSSLIELATDHGRLPVVVQAYLDAVRHGNTRLFVVDGEVIGSVVRFPGAGDFRIGAPAELADVTDRDRALVARLAPSLRRHGLWLVGLDIIDGRLIEVNVTSPGAMRKADAALGTRFNEEVISRFERMRGRSSVDAIAFAPSV
jgi:glutathione synthase